MRSFLAYQVTESAEEIIEGETYQSYKYPNMVKTRTGFKLSVMKGSFNDSQIIVLLRCIGRCQSIVEIQLIVAMHWTSLAENRGTDLTDA